MPGMVLWLLGWRLLNWFPGDTDLEAEPCSLHLHPSTSTRLYNPPAQIISLPRVFINDFSDNWMRHRQPVCLVKAGPRIFDWIMVAKYFSLLSILKYVTFFIKYFWTNLHLCTILNTALSTWMFTPSPEPGWAEHHYSVRRILCLKARAVVVPGPGPGSWRRDEHSWWMYQLGKHH